MNFGYIADVTNQDELKHIKQEFNDLLKDNKELSKYMVIFVDVPVVSKSKYYPVYHDNDEDKYIYVYIVRPSTNIHTTNRCKWITNPLYHIVIDNLRLRNNLRDAANTFSNLLLVANSAGITDYESPNNMVRKCTLDTIYTNGLTLSDYIINHVLATKTKQNFEALVSDNKDTDTHINFITKLINEVIEGKKQKKFDKITNYRAYCSDVRLIKLIEAYNTLVS